MRHRAARALVVRARALVAVAAGEVGAKVVALVAVPLAEGLAEKVNWLQKGIPHESFGAALLAAGVPLEKIEAWTIDPRVRLPAGDEGSLFDALEDLDAPECLAKCIELAKL